MCSRRRKALISSGLSACTGVRQVSSNSRIVCLLMAPTSCRASIVSWMAARASLRYFLGIFYYLLKLSICNQLTQLRVRQGQDMLGHFLELRLFIIADVAELALGKTVHEERRLTFAKKNDATVAFGLAFSGTGDPLFDDTTTQVCINLSILSSFDRIPKHISRDFLFPGKAPKPCVLENLQAEPPIFTSSVYHTRRYTNSRSRIIFDALAEADLVEHFQVVAGRPRADSSDKIEAQP